MGRLPCTSMDGEELIRARSTPFGRCVSSKLFGVQILWFILSGTWDERTNWQ